MKISKSRIKEIIKEELEGPVGRIADPRSFDPEDPQVIVRGAGTYRRSHVRKKINAMLADLSDRSRLARSASDYQVIDRLIYQKWGNLKHFLQAELDVAEELEQMRRRGGIRSRGISKQYEYEE